MLLLGGAAWAGALAGRWAGLVGAGARRRGRAGAVAVLAPARRPAPRCGRCGRWSLGGGRDRRHAARRPGPSAARWPGWPRDGAAVGVRRHGDLRPAAGPRAASASWSLVRLDVREVTGRGATYALAAPVLVIGRRRLARRPARRHGARVRSARRRPTATTWPRVLGARGRPRWSPPRTCGGAAPPRCGRRSATPSRTGRTTSARWCRRWSTATTPGSTPALADDFRTTGLTHLLAVSGTNLTLVVGFLLVLARWGRVRGRWLLRRRRRRDRRVRAARPHRAERAAGRGDGHGRAVRDGRQRPPARRPRARGRGRSCCCWSSPAWRCRPGSRCRCWPPPGSCCSLRAGATRWPAGCRAGWPRRSRSRRPPSSPARRWSPRSPARSAWSRWRPTSPAAPAVGPATVLGLGGRAGRAGLGRRRSAARHASPAGASPGSSRSRPGAPTCRRPRSDWGTGVRSRSALLTVLVVAIALAGPVAAAPAGHRDCAAAPCWWRASLVRPPTPGLAAGRLGAGRVRRRPGRRAGAQRRPGARRGRRRRARPGRGRPLPRPARGRGGAAGGAHPLPRRPRRRARRRARRPHGRRGRDHPAARPARAGWPRSRRWPSRSVWRRPGAVRRDPPDRRRHASRCSGRRRTRRRSGPATAAPPTTPAWCCSPRCAASGSC